MARITCTTDGFTDNWIELSESWTRREAKELDQQAIDGVLDSLRRKATACHIITNSGAVLDTPEQLTEEHLEDCDQQVFGFILGCQFRLVGALQSLGNFNVRLSSAIAGKTK